MNDTTSPDDYRSIDRADVYKGDRLAGYLIRDESDILFVYDDDYRADPRASAIAWTIPLNDDPVRAGSGSVPPFFAGLLPEGTRLQAIVGVTRTSYDDHLTLLLAVGADTVGDVRVVPSGTPPADPPPTIDTERVAEADLAAVFAKITGSQTLAADASAIPGVQPKISASMISAPLMTSHGPDILKLNPPQYPRLVENESFFLDMAASCELSTPEHRIVHDRNGRSGLLVRRFDRIVETGGLRRLAQEDACQVMDAFPARKYALRLGDIVSTLATTCERGGGSRAVATMQMLRLIAFCYLIGNTDLHGKNISIRQDASGSWEVTPAYDLVSTLPYFGWNEPMALELFGRANRLDRAHMVESAARWDIRPRAVERMLDRLCERAEPWLDRLDTIGYDDRVTALLRDAMARRVSELRDR